MAIDAVSNGFGSTGLNIQPAQYKSQKPQADTLEVNAPSVDTTTSQVAANYVSSPTEPKKEEQVGVKNSGLKSEDEYSKKTRTEEENRKKRLKEEEEEKQKTEEQRKAEMQKLVEELNKKMNQFGSSIKFGVNDKENSMAVTVLDGSNSPNMKNISTKDAEKLADRMSYVLGILFDQKA